MEKMAAAVMEGGLNKVATKAHLPPKAYSRFSQRPTRWTLAASAFYLLGR